MYLYAMNYEAIIAVQEKTISLQKEKIISLELLNRDYLHQLEQLKKLIYGRRSERFVPNIEMDQLNLFSQEFAQEQEQVVEEKETITYERKKSKHQGRQLLSGCGHLPVEEQIIDIEHDDQDIHIGDEISTKLAYKPGKLYRKNTIRRKYKKANSDQIIIADPVVEPIARCEADVSLLAHITVSKFVDHLPEYRQQQIFKREGVVIPSSTMNGWVHQLGPHIELMAKHIKTKILESKYIQQDESTIKVMDGKKQSTHLGYMWVMSSPQLKYVCFEYMKGRGREGPMKTYAGYEGDLQTDAYEVYEIIDKAYKQINHFYCWAHARRKFIEAQSNDKTRSDRGIHEIQKLYAIEQICRDQNLSYDQRLEQRKQAIPILEEFKKWLDNQVNNVTPSSPIGKAILYLLKRWDKFTKYTQYGHVEIDNNQIENIIRMLALGRKNYLFAGNHDAAANIGHYYTIFGSCKALGINPYDYMLWFLGKVSSTKISMISTIAPDAYNLTGNQNNM
jgi:transposase